MLTGFYSSVSGIYYNEQKLASTSHNIANAETTGFRRALMMLRSREENANTKWVDSDVRPRHPEIYGIQRNGVHVDHKRAGRIRQTDNPMHVAMAPELKNSFWKVKRDDPRDQEIYYTRNGTLSFGNQNPNDPNSPTVLKVSGHLALGPDNQPIEIDPAEGELRITDEGAIYQNNNLVAELPVFRLDKSADPMTQQSANLQALHQLGESLYKVPADKRNEFHAHRIEVGQAGVNRVMKQGALEASNVNVFSEMIEMMNTSQAAKANQTAIQHQMDSLSKLFQLVRR